MIARALGVKVKISTLSQIMLAAWAFEMEVKTKIGILRFRSAVNHHAAIHPVGEAILNQAECITDSLGSWDEG